jgi:pleiotropic regulator 1
MFLSLSTTTLDMGTSEQADLELLVESNRSSTHLLFGPAESASVAYPPTVDPSSANVSLRAKYADFYSDAVNRYAANCKNSTVGAVGDDASEQHLAISADQFSSGTSAHVGLLNPRLGDGADTSIIDMMNVSASSAGLGMSDTAESAGNRTEKKYSRAAEPIGSSTALLPALRPAAYSEDAVAVKLARDRPLWHAPWKMFRVIMGHAGWVRCVAVDPENKWFVTGSADRTIKIWDLASGKLKLTLTGHISTVRGVAISDKHPYMFSVGEDKMVKCWDLEQNKVIRHYHGHLSGIYTVGLHPTLDVLMTGGRDAVVRVWDMRTKRQIFALSGHRDTVNSIVSQTSDPQIISGSVDSTIRLWDLAAGKCMSTLTNHKKGVRCLALNPAEFSFASASADNIKTWGLPQGQFMRNLSGHQSLVNALAVNQDGVLVSGADDGQFRFWDYQAAHCFQNEATKVQPGSLESEAGVYALAFDRSGSRLLSCHGDKTIRVWREDDTATQSSVPLT